MFRSNALLKASVFLAGGVAILLSPLFFPLRMIRDRRKVTIVIEAGERGWEILEYQELGSSAAEYFGQENCEKLVVFSQQAYFIAVLKKLIAVMPEYYLYDPRSSADEGVLMVLEAMLVSAMFRGAGVRVLCTLTDVPIDQWRWKCNVMAFPRGPISVLMSPRRIKKFFLGCKLVGPQPMAISEKFFLSGTEKNKLSEPLNGEIFFLGSLYEPRRSFLQAVSDQLARDNLRPIRFIGQDLGAKKSPNCEYRSRLVEAGAVITTCSQISTKSACSVNDGHLVYRFTEAMSCGALVIGELPRGSEQVYRPNVDYLAFEDVQSCVEAIKNFYADPDRYKDVRQNGYSRAKALALSGYFWRNLWT